MYFLYSDAARRYPQHKANMVIVRNQRPYLLGDNGKRAELLAQRFHGQAVFDPTVLTDEFRKTCSLADFIGCN